MDEQHDPDAETDEGRRRFLLTTATAAAGLAVGCGGGSVDPGDAAVDVTPADATPPDTSPPMDSAPPVDAGPLDDPTELPASASFGLGVASGDVTETTAILWTRYDGDLPLELAVWEMDADVYLRETYAEMATVETGGYVHVDASGFTGGARYRYAFFELLEDDVRGARSPVGRFRAAFAVDATEPLLLGAVSCTNNGRDFATIERAGERDDLDVFLLVGDTTYNDGAETRTEYQQKWGENLGTPGYLALRERVSVLAAWDDHEVVNNWDPESTSPGQIVSAREAMFDSLPLRPDPVAPERLWKRMRWGLTADIFVLDSRGERLPSTRRTDDAIYLSREQMDWFKAELEASPAVFKIILNTVPITEYPLVFDVAIADRWEGYASQREEILSFIDDGGITGVFWVSGDFHFCSAQRVSTSGAGSSATEVLVGPGAQTANPAHFALLGGQFDFTSGKNCYSTLALDPTTGEVTVSWIDGDGDAFEERVYSLV